MEFLEKLPLYKQLVEQGWDGPQSFALSYYPLFCAGVGATARFFEVHNPSLGVQVGEAAVYGMMFYIGTIMAAFPVVCASAYLGGWNLDYHGLRHEYNDEPAPDDTLEDHL